MQLQDLFDTLLADRKIAVVLDKPAAEALRVMLAKKWSAYKKLMDSCGFLAPDLASCSLCRRWPTTPDGPVVFELAPRKKNITDYVIVTLTTSENNDASV